MPKLFQINVSSNVGSTCYIAEQIGKIAIYNGWESYIAYGRFNQKLKSISIKIGFRLFVYFLVIKTILSDRPMVAFFIIRRN